jgi:DNA-binding MarR family transcriptional regulator
MKEREPLEKHIGYWLRFVSNQVSLAFANELAAYDVSIAEWVMLNFVSVQTQSLVVIAKEIGMTKGAASKVLDKLFHKQLIDRTESVNDRRYLTISLSEKGRGILPHLMKVADENDHYFFGHLSKEEKNIIIKFLKEIVSINQWKNIPVD